MQAHAAGGDQREVPLAEDSGYKGSPNIRRRRLAGRSEFNCFHDAARSLSVKGCTSCSFGICEDGTADDGGLSGEEVEVELGVLAVIQTGWRFGGVSLGPMRHAGQRFGKI